MRKLWKKNPETENQPPKIERPLVLVGFSYLAALMAAVVFGKNAALFLAAGFAVLFVLSLFLPTVRRGRIFPAALFTAATACFVFTVYHTAAVEPAEALHGVEAEVSGTLCELPDAQYGKYYYELQVDSISVEGAPKIEKVRFSSQKLLPMSPYDQITCCLHFYLPPAGEGFSSRAYYASKGIPILAFLDEYAEPQYAPAEKRPLYYYALVIREKTEEALFSMLPETEAGLLSGVLLGDKAAVSEETIADFRASGASHLLAVSGLHMTVLIAALMGVLRKLRLPRRFTAGLCMAAVVVFMAVTGFTPSVVRSGIMYLIYLFAQIVQREPDSLSSLGAAVLVLCGSNPYAAADVGLLLSVTATLGMILFSARLQTWMQNRLFPKAEPRVLRWLRNGLISALSGTLSALVLTLPVTILSFGTVSLIAPLSNLLLLYPSSLMLELTALSALLFYIPVFGILAPVFAAPAGWLADYMLWVSRTVSRIPFASVPASYGFVTFWIAATALLAAVVLFFRGGTRVRRTAAMLSVCILAAGIVSFRISRAGMTRVVLADSGNSICAVVSKDGEGVVVGCGGFSEATAEELLDAEQVRSVSGIVVIDASYREYRNAASLLEKTKPGFLMVRPEIYIDGYTERALQENAPIKGYDLTDTAGLWDDMTITLMEAGKGAAVLLHTGAADLLFCGPDADLSALSEELVPDLLICTVLPEGAFRLDPAYTLFSAYADTAEEQMGAAGENCGWMAATGGEGTLAIAIEGDTYTIGRER